MTRSLKAYAPSITQKEQSSKGGKMVIFTPKVGRLIALDGMMDRLERDFLPRALSELKDRGGQEVVASIVRDCCTEKVEEHHGVEVTRFSIRAIVMSEEEFKRELERAYLEGMHDVKPRFGG